jgi:hypothetical protein
VALSHHVGIDRSLDRVHGSSGERDRCAAHGSADDAARIGRILSGEDLTPEQLEARSGLDALIACYVALEGPKALDVVDRLFLDRADREVPFTETYAAVMALRFLGEESDLVPRDRVLQSLRLLLAEPKLADLVIADLARWQDWSVVDRLVTLFKDAKSDNIFVREPIVNYLRACPLPEAAAAVENVATEREILACGDARGHFVLQLRAGRDLQLDDAPERGEQEHGDAACDHEGDEVEAIDIAPRGAERTGRL